MASSEERLRILKMISEGQITAQEGAKLLEAMREPTPASTQDEPTKPRWLRVQVSDRNSSKTKLNVNIPLGLLDVGMKMGARFAPTMEGMDLSAIQSAIKSGFQGRILSVDDEKDGETVDIYVE
jgi:hypothetical protein